MSTAIDTHAHVYPAWYLDQLESEGVAASTTSIARNMNADSTEEDMARRLEWMDRAGVAMQVLAVSPQSPATGESARAINDEYLRLVEAYPQRFLAYAAVPLSDVEASIAELNRIEKLGFVGVSLPTFLRDGGSLGDSALLPVWEKLNDMHAVVNIHPTGQGACSAPIKNFHLDWVNGALVEDSTATLQLLKADIPDKFSNITIHVAHLGGDLAFMFQRLEDNYRDWDAFARSPQEALRGMFFDAANFYEPALRLAVETYGASQVLGGSDFPYFQEDKYVRAFDYIRDAQLDELTKRAILSDNARRLYGLDSSPR